MKIRVITRIFFILLLENSSITKLPLHSIMDKAAFSLEKYSFDKALIDFTISGDRELEINFKPSGIFKQQNENSVFELKFIFEAKSKDISKPFVTIECNSIFHFANKITFDEIPSFFYVNSIAIIFPYVRAFVSTVTLQSNHPPIILPTLNLSSLEQQLREKTTEEK